MVASPASSSWLLHLKAYLDSDFPASAQVSSRDAIVNLIKQNAITLSQITLEMGDVLTSIDDPLRARGTLLLGELWLNLKEKPQDDNTIHQFATFFSARLEDWHCLHGTLLGCLGLLKRAKDVGSISCEDAKSLLEAALENLQVQSLAQQNRMVCLELFECLLLHHLEAVVHHGAKFSEALCDMIDGEKDPRCLLIGFHVIELATQVFPDDTGPIGSVSEELFGILSCYFPISFNPASDDKWGITREDISIALMHCFGSTKLFAEFCIPFLLEKLASSLKSAKLDSLKFLGYCVARYGRERTQKHSAAIWMALRQELLSSHRAGEIGLTTTDETVSKEALECLEICLKSLQANNYDPKIPGKEELLQLVLQDGFVDDFFNCLQHYLVYKDQNIVNSSSSSCSEISSADRVVFDRALARIKEAGLILGVAMKASPETCFQVSQSLLKTLTDIMRPGIDITEADISNFFDGIPVKTNLWFPGPIIIAVLEVLSSLVKGARQVAEDFWKKRKPTTLDINWMAPLLAYSQIILQTFLAAIVSGMQHHMFVEAALIEKLWEAGVAGLQAVGSFPPQVSLLSKDQNKYLMTFLKSIILEKSEVMPLWNHVVQAIEAIFYVEETFLHDSLTYGPMDAFISLLLEELIEGRHKNLSAQNNLKTLSVLCKGRPVTLASVMRKLTGVVCEALKEEIYLTNGDGEDCRRVSALLQGVLDYILPCCESTHVEAEVMQELGTGMWDAVEKLPDHAFAVDSIQTSKILECCLEIVQFSVSRCDKTFQRHLLLKALDTFNDALSHLSEIVRARDIWVIGFFAKTIIPLWPVVQIPEEKGVLNCLLAAAVSSLCGAVNMVASEAIGCMLNKCGSSVEKGLARSAVDAAVREATELITEGEWISTAVLHQRSSCNIPVPEESLLWKRKCIKLLAFSGKGLAMRGHIAVSDIAMTLLNLVLSKKSLLGACPGNLPNILWPSDEEKSAISCDAAEALGFIVKDTQVFESKERHLVVKPLYQQRFFVSMLPPLMLLLKDTDGQEKVMLYYAFGNLISGVPVNVILTETSRVFPLLLESLSTLSGNELHSGVLLNALLALSAILVDKNGVEAASHQVSAMIGRLLALTSYKYSPVIRETSLLCLGALVVLPYTRVFPFRTRVLKSLTNALDDPKRTVRKEAIKCRRAWESLLQ